MEDFKDAEPGEASDQEMDESSQEMSEAQETLDKMEQKNLTSKKK